jgi:hypothetical protein
VESRLSSRPDQTGFWNTRQMTKIGADESMIVGRIGGGKYQVRVRWARGKSRPWVVGLLSLYPAAEALALKPSEYVFSFFSRSP